MSPLTDRFSPSSVRSLYSDSLSTCIFQSWSPISFFGLHAGLKTYVENPVVLVSFLNTAASVIPSSVSVNDTFIPSTKVPLSWSNTLTYSTSVMGPVLLAMLLFPVSSWNCSVSLVTVKLFRFVSSVVFVLPTVLVALNLYTHVASMAWSFVRFMLKFRFLCTFVRK